MTHPLPRRFPIGAELVPDGVSFRVWAPSHQRVSVVLDGGEHPLAADQDGYFAGTIAGLAAGARYRFRLDDDAMLYPDPASRFQPERPTGPSQVVDPAAFGWTDQAWTGLTINGQVLYEMHIGTFTPEGTWAAAAKKLPFLKDVGITVVNMMPVNDFQGRFGWGYDGVDLFAPTRLYGEPDDLRAFVDAAHSIGLGVILDVVYNHIGPDGNFLNTFAKDYFTDRHKTDWGEALNYDGPNAHGMRDLTISNAAYWIAEYHFDGLRLDATQNIYDDSADHVVAALGRAARSAAGSRSIIIVAENEPQNTDLVRPAEAGGFGLDAVWNDDLHHSAMVAATGRSEFYYKDYEGSPQELISAAKYGYLFQGQIYGASGEARGTPALDLNPDAFVTFTQNHDQVANSARGLRLHQVTSPATARAITAFSILMPGTPMLFQGQEFWASAPFRYFADHHPDLAKLVRAGRHQYLAQFPSLATPASQAQLPDPESLKTFEICKLDWSEVERNAEILDMHRDLLRLRRDDRAFNSHHRPAADGAVLAPHAFLVRFLERDGDDRLMIVNLGRDLNRPGFSEPLVAPPRGKAWAVQWSSEDPAYGGTGTPDVETAKGWHIPGQCAIVMRPVDPKAASSMPIDPPSSPDDRTGKAPPQT
ncbi:malto-oligosyltrehalose trehalohydrolase [Lichenihabitans psoromatis]|uniref:malto-oligosyltrehalose trehalohydrolase n=1 Tax=Lichenihabitans psoromatis TaxID=2528642 RepID=UPI00103846FB|nr:malto-oligosyltrehalose trehalohydrolase [Lichenihabitans psoromatis]